MSQMSTEERLVYMANQIARNFAIAGDDKAALATADHIAMFWDPSMKARLFSPELKSSADLDPIARMAFDYLKLAGTPQPQSQATKFGDILHDGSSDAG